MKMETPKMDVVRFKEADVIVASPAPIAEVVTLSALGNSDFDDNVVSGNGFSLAFPDISNGSYAHLLKLDSTFNNGTSQKTLKNLVDSTKVSDDDSYGAFNGTYQYDDTTGVYRLQ